MPTVSDLNVRLGLITKNFDRELASFERKMQGVAGRMGAAGDRMAVAFTAPLLAISALSVKALADFESLTLAMTTTMEGVGRGSAAAAEEIEKLRQAALAPGLNFEQAVQGSVRLQSVGFSAEKARSILVELGNAIASSGGSAEQLDAVTKQLSQIAGKGRLLQEDLTIILENMPALAKTLRDEFGTTSAEAIRQLGVSAEDFIDRITTRMQTLPRVAGGISNAITNAGVAIRQSAARIGEALNKAFNVSGNLEVFATWITGLADRFANLDGPTQRAIIGVGVFAAALGPAVKLVSVLVSTSTAVYGAFSRIAESFRLTAAAGTGTIGVFSRMNTAMKLNIFIAGASAILALALALKSMNIGAQEASESQKIFAEQQQIVTKEVGRETAALNRNFEVLKNTASSTEDRKKAVQDLVAQYPQYLRGIDLEKANLLQLNDIQAQVTDSILRSVAERQKAIAVEGEYNKIVQAQLRINQLRQKGFAALSGEEVKRAGLSLFGTEFEKGFVSAGARAEAVQSVIAALGDDVKRATTTAKELETQFDSTFGIGTKAANRQYDALTQQRQAVEDAEFALDSMTDAQRSALEWSKKIDAQWSAQKASSEGVTRSANLYRDALASIAAIAGNSDALGADIASEQAGEIEKQIKRLVENGYKPYGKQVQHLRDMLKDLRAESAIGFFTPNTTQSALSEIKKIDDAIGEIAGKLPLPSVLLQAGVSMNAPQLPTLSIPNQVFSLDTSPAIIALESLQETAIRAFDVTDTLGGKFAEIGRILAEATGPIGSFSTALSDAMTLSIQNGDILGATVLAASQAMVQASEQGASSFGQIAAAAAGAAAKVVRAWIQQGVAAAVAKALSGLPFPANLAAGAIAGVAASALFNKAIKSIGIPALAQGGIAKKPTLALIGEYSGANKNPEIVAPENTIREIFRTEGAGLPYVVSTRVSGSDLLIVLERENSKSKRIRGY